ncbi:dipeptidase [uncultured Pseudoflavonifractor sp.]|uniref:dipeptidase n=1 Tax=uncultured Pseudoflavonifractor sp. TaxID=1221379 RepID=UPI0025E32736|nr:dipeptidase [uncultured Pseudoflavonifractor sp.]
MIATERVCLFDGHCDTISRCFERGGGIRKSDGHLDLERTASFGPYAQFFAIFGDAAAEANLTPRQLFQEEYAIFQRELAANRDLAVHCRTAKEADAAFQAGKCAAFLSVEGAELLDCSLEHLEEAYRLGVRAVNLTWNHANILSGSNAEEQERGLSEYGKAFVRRMNQLGMLVDVSHLSEPGFWDVAEFCKGPFIASHSNARAVFSAPRNLTDGQFTAIIEYHGVAGLNMFADFLGDDPDYDTVISHLEHFLSLGGEKNVAIGGDWDGISKMPRGMSGIQDMAELYERLLRRNYSEALVRDVFFNNLMRVVSEVCTM